MLRQLNRLVDNGYIHGDMRSTNIVVDPATGVFTIIDFDWFYTKPVFLNKYYQYFGYYSNPPETLLAASNPDEKAEYISDFKMYFINHSIILTIDIMNHENDRFLRSLSAGRVINKDIAVWNKTLDTFDSFGLGWTLLQLFAHLYPRSLNNDVARLKVELKPIISAFGTPYTEEELDTYATAINSFVRRVLFPMGNFNVEHRQSARESYERAMAILASVKP